MTQQPLGQATTTKEMFSRETTVSTRIAADPAIVWALLTDAPGYPRWNSTVVSIDGEIRPGGDLQLVSTLDPTRTFKLAVREMTPETRLVWGDRMGERTYAIEPDSRNAVLFTMTERIGGLMFPLFAGQLPSFDESFDQFAADLKREAEAIQQSEG